MSNTPQPGSDAAINQGCKCPVLDNAHGRGYMGIPGIYVYSGDCPLHNPLHWEIRVDYEKAKERCR